MTKDEKMLVKHLTSKVASIMLAETLESIYMAQQLHEYPSAEDIEKCGAELMKACEITGPITTTADGHIAFGDYITEKKFDSMSYVRAFIALTAANNIKCNDII